jgi:hypothetical protein
MPLQASDDFGARYFNPTNNTLSIHNHLFPAANTGLAWLTEDKKLPDYPDVIAAGILLLPENLGTNEKRPVVVCQHGLEGRPSDLAHPDIQNNAYNKYAFRLAELGFVTFAPQNAYIGRTTFRQVLRKAQPLGLTLWSFIVRQHERILDWLVTLDFVDGVHSKNITPHDIGNCPRARTAWLLVRDSAVNGNRASETGGGVSNGSSAGTGDVRVVRTTVARNVAGSDGGGIAVVNSSLTLTDSTVRRNVASGSNEWESNDVHYADHLYLNQTAPSGPVTFTEPRLCRDSRSLAEFWWM